MINRDFFRIFFTQKLTIHFQCCMIMVEVINMVDTKKHKLE